jgi:hypothetical protein
MTGNEIVVFENSDSLQEKPSFHQLKNYSELVIREFKKPLGFRQRMLDVDEGKTDEYMREELPYFNRYLTYWAGAWASRSYFNTVDEAHKFISEATTALDGFEQMYDCLLDRYRVFKTKELVSKARTPKERFLFWLSILLAPVTFFLSLTYFDMRLKPPAEWFIWVSAVLYAIAPWMLFDFIRTKIAKRHYKKNPLEASPELLGLMQRCKTSREMLNFGKGEIFDEIEHQKFLRREKDRRELDDVFQERAIKRSSAERLAIIEAELRAGKETAKTLEEQHLNTEAIRVKYAKELIDLQRQVKAEDNQDLTDKLLLLQEVLNDR